MSSQATGSSTHHDFSKKEEFRRYLEKSGLLDALTKVLVGLYEGAYFSVGVNWRSFFRNSHLVRAEPERPKNAIDYVKKFLGAPTSVDIDGLRRENEELKRQLETVRKQSGTRK